MTTREQYEHDRDELRSLAARLSSITFRFESSLAQRRGIAFNDGLARLASWCEQTANEIERNLSRAHDDSR